MVRLSGLKGQLYSEEGGEGIGRTSGRADGFHNRAVAMQAMLILIPGIADKA